MRKMLKRGFAAIIAVMLCFGAMPIAKTSFEAVAANGVQARINEVASKFPSGTYFTVNGAGCGHASGDVCNNCKLSKVLPAHGVAYDSSKYPDGWTCYAFASFCFGYTFGKPFTSAVGAVSSGNVTSDSGLYDAFKQAKTGDFVYCFRGGSVGHYAIFISCDTNGVTLFHNNVGGGGLVGKIAYGYIPYSSLRGSGWSYINRVDIYRATNYDDVNGPSDTMQPTISNVKISNLNSSGYTVTCTVSDNVGVTRVAFPTWTEKNGHDDIIWHEGTRDGNSVSCNIKISDHKNERGAYTTHIYAYDAAGNYSSVGKNIVVPNPDTEDPLIEVCEVYSKNSAGYTIRAKVSDNVGVTSVRFPTWTDKQTGSESIWLYGTYNSKDGYWYCTVEIKNWNYYYGSYKTHCYAYDADGNYSACDLGYTRISDIVIFTDSLANKGTYDINSEQTLLAKGWAFNRNGDITTCYYAFDPKLPRNYHIQINPATVNPKQ